MNKKYIIAAAIIIVIIAIAAYERSKKPLVDIDSTEHIFAATSSTNGAVASATSSKPLAQKTSLLQGTPYTDASSKFSIYLPLQWSLKAKSNSTSTSDSVFSNGASTMTVKRFPRTDQVEQVVSSRGSDAFLSIVADNLKTEISGYSVTATSSVVINGQKYYKVSGKYVGQSSKKEVIQYIYLALSKDAYYLVGFDIYSDAWAQAKDALLESVSTFRQLP